MATENCWHNYFNFYSHPSAIHFPKLLFFHLITVIFLALNKAWLLSSLLFSPLLLSSDNPLFSVINYFVIKKIHNEKICTLKCHAVMYLHSAGSKQYKRENYRQYNPCCVKW